MKKVLAIIMLCASLVMTPWAETSAAGVNSSWAVIDADTGRLLDGDNPHEQLPIASLTKIWTALTFIEADVEQKNTVISQEAASAEGSSIYLEPGSKVSSTELLYGLMLRSGNDAAAALAEHAGGSQDGFVKMMNEQATLYGLKDTHFTNPSGLHNETHLSTAYETAMMLYFGMKNKEFKKIASTKTYKRRGENSGVWENKHRLITSKTDAVAGKTGFTKAAGRTLATYFEKDGKKVIVVTLNNGNDWNIHKSLAADVFQNYNLMTVAKKGKYSLLPGVTAKLNKPIKLLLKQEEKSKVSSVMKIPRIQTQSAEGQWTVSLDNEPLVTTLVQISRE
ncbi:D-alanyl-D-alanine carboxypeptidase family protein [Sporosarcina aquimarina]|uniref:Serine hydrolase n=1 Tax=Sporosarcina aquimarina TaxID=114975 RepID=A0ABU4FWN5_9BACL|nr:serine hydrolase [Sporosarcina aquimarina]MDW0109114.1 serine hydrolase [Sporosarcina aquimarina]